MNSQHTTRFDSVPTNGSRESSCMAFCASMSKKYEMLMRIGSARGVSGQRAPKPKEKAQAENTWRPFTEEEIKQILQLRKEGVSFREVAKKMNRSTSSCYQLVKQLKNGKKPAKRSNSSIMREMARQGKSVQEISLATKTPVNQVKARLRCTSHIKW